MDGIDTFMSNFERALDEKDSNNLTYILQDRKYFQDISRSETELALSKLFNEDSGLFWFLKNELSRTIPRSGFDTAIKKGIELIEFIIEQFPDVFTPYITETKEICVIALTTNCSAHIQKKACELLKILIKSFKDDIPIDGIVKSLVSKLQLLDIKERSLALSVIGRIARYFPQNPEVHECYETIFNRLYNDFRKQYAEARKNRNVHMNIYFDTLADLLEECPDESVRKYSQEMYGWIKDFSEPKSYKSGKITSISAIKLLFKTVDLFRDFIYREYMFWYNLLVQLTNDKTEAEPAQRMLKKFYHLMGETIKSKNSNEDKAIFEYFKNLFEERLKGNCCLDWNELRPILYGYSQMAAPCKTYLTESDVKDMFVLIARCAAPLSSRDDLDKVHLETICGYQEALSEIILHMSDLSIEQINIITKLIILLIKKYPEIPVAASNYATSSIINTICNVGAISKSLLDEFLYNLFHDGVVWTCSHNLLVDAELRQGMYDLKERPRCYKNYLPFWKQLLQQYKYNSPAKLQILQHIVSSLMNVCIVILNRLNLRTKVKEESVFSDVALTETAVNAADFRIFINVTDLYVDIFKVIEPLLLKDTIHDFLHEVIGASYKHPLISGFYKLVRATFKHVSGINKNEIGTELLELLYKYLTNVLTLISTFSNELLLAALYLILDTPVMYVEYVLPRTIPAFKIAFTMGLSDLDLAYAALTTLEKWIGYMGSRRTKDFTREVVPLLEPFLQSQETPVEFLQDIIKSERKVIKHIVLVDNEKTLESLQRRILLLISSLNIDVVMDFVYKKAAHTGATWDHKNLLKQSLPLSDLKVDIYFDKILPRLLALAQNSGDRQTKVNACELLHAMVAFILGETYPRLIPNTDSCIATLYMELCPALLNLGCDSDEIARKIFYPLMLQLTHWLSSPFMMCSPAAKYLLDSLFNGLCNSSNSSLREFSGLCLAEFTAWSIKQCDTQPITHTNIQLILRDIMNFALHPSSRKRIAAAIAFNHLYTILREDDKIISMYWLEILYSFVKSLDGCNDQSIFNALGHIERVLIAKRHLLSKTDPERRKPSEFENATFMDAVNWLFVQCGSLDEQCRKKCMELFTKLSVYVPEIKSARAIIKKYVETHGIDALKRIIIKESHMKLENLTSKGILPLLKMFDFYIWLIRENLVDNEFLLTIMNPIKEIIFNTAKNFVDFVNKIKMETEEKEKQEGILVLSKELEQLQILRCKAIITMFDFLQLLLTFHDGLIPKFFLNTQLFVLISKSVMYPQMIGFDMKHHEIAERLQSTVESLLNSMMEHENNTLIQSIKNELVNCIKKHVPHFLNLDEIVSNTVNLELKQFMKGLIILEHCNILKNLPEKILKEPEDEIVQVFKALSKERMGELICINIKAPTMDYLQDLMQLLLMNYKPSVTKTLINLIADDTKLGPDTVRIEHGQHFLRLFKKVILKYILRDVEQTIRIIIDSLQGNATLLLTIIEDLLLHVQKRKKELQENTDALADVIIKEFSSLERAVNNFADRKEKLINIYGIAVHLKQRPMEILSINEEFYGWILKQLTEQSDLEYKVRILKNFLVCLTDGTTTNRVELVAILRTLRVDRLGILPNNTFEENVKGLKVINCFQTLVSLLPITESTVVFESIILFAMGISQHLWNDKTNEYLEKYFDIISSEDAVASLEIAFKIFMDSSKSVEERLEVLNRFFLVVFEFCKKKDIETFFEKSIKQIYTIIRQSLVGNDTDVKHLIVSQIGCYNLIGIMFAKVPTENICSVESTITQNAIEKVSTGKELLQQLFISAISVRSFKTSNPVHKELMRLLHCAAYNCSISFVCLKKDEKIYESVFAENKKAGQLIWENIIDCDKPYNLQQTLQEYPKNRKKLINIRKARSEEKGNWYNYTYDISASSLHEDMNAYDFNEMTVCKEPNKVEKEESMSLMFECDDLNNHECMATLCGVLNHLKSKEISLLPTEGTTAPPKWLKCLHYSFTLTNQDNVRIFMLKFIYNMQSIFKPYGALFLPAIINAVYFYLKRNNLNYVITDILIMLQDWHTVAIPIENNDKAMAQKLFERLIEKVMLQKSDVSDSIIEYNINLIKELINVWSKCVKLPGNLTDIINSAPTIANHLILMCFQNEMGKEIIAREDIIEFLENSVENLSAKEHIILQTYENLGFVLEYLSEEEKFANKKYALCDKIRNAFQKMQEKNNQKLQIRCIRALCKNHQPAAVSYLEFVTTRVVKLNESGKTDCLEIFLLAMPNLQPEQIRNELDYMKFSDMLKNKTLSSEVPALKIIDSLISIATPSDLIPRLKLVRPYAKHKSSEYREYAYNIFMKTYKQYSSRESESEDVKTLLDMSNEVLLLGLLDPAEKLQADLLDFWTQDAKLVNTCRERLLEILNVYTPNAGNAFLPFILLMMLNLTSKSLNYMDKLFPPLIECNYVDYKIAYSWRTKNLGTMAPLFAPSLASQMSETFTQTGSTLPGMSLNQSYSGPVRDQGFLLRATQEPQFEPTEANEQSTVSEISQQYDGEFKVPAVPQPAFNKRSRRIVRDRTYIGSIMREREINKNIKRAVMIKEEGVRQRSSVKIYRKYRTGDFPDIEISLSSIIQPLQQLAKRDQLICRDLVVSIICSLLKQQNSEDYKNRISATFMHIIENNQGSNSIVAATLEILLYSRISCCPPEIISRASKLNSSNLLGSLLLEDNVIYGSNNLEPVAKRTRTENLGDSSNEWLHLANLYESMNDVDVVLSIFQNHIHDEDMKEAAFAQAGNDWPKARAAYIKAYEKEAESMKEHSLQGLLECLSNMYSWIEIEKHIEKKLNHDINNIWDDAWKGWLFPWLMEVQVRNLLKEDSRDSFTLNVRKLESWMRNTEKQDYVKRFFGEEMAMFFLHDNLEVARDYLTNSLDQVREQWIRLHPLSTQLRIKKLQKLRQINDTNSFLNTLKEIDASCNLRSILQFWKNNVPSEQDQVLPWDRLILSRTYFASILTEKVEDLMNDESQNDSEQNTPNMKKSEIIFEISSTSCKQQLKIVRAALHQKSKFLARKYMARIEQQIQNCRGSVEHEFLLVGAKTKYLSGEFEEDLEKKINYYSSSWKYAHLLMRRSNLDVKITVETRQHISTIASEMIEMSHKNETFAELLRTLVLDKTILPELTIESDNLEGIREALENYSFNNLKICSTTATDNARDCYFILSKYCYDRISGGTENVNLYKEFINSTLRAMRYGSCEAAQYFPCLLKSEYLESEETRKIFSDEVKGIQTWLFLAWQSQLFSHLNSPLSELVVPILERIAQTYPNAIIYTLRLMTDTNPSLLNNSATYKIRQLLYARVDVEQFLVAMHYLVQPELYVLHYLNELLNNISLGVATAVDMFIKQVYPDPEGNSPRPGKIYEEIATYRDEVKAWEYKQSGKVKSLAYIMIENIKRTFRSRKDRVRLKDYSPWLYKYSGGDLEIPGQYSGNREPMPQYHVKIMKIEPTVEVMKSLRKPIRITMVGNDAKNYNFLVKFGEDLRLDQRIQQLFNIMNKILQSDATCKPRQLSIDTYQVIPLSSTLGLIQVIQNTRSLHDLIHFTLSTEKVERYNETLMEYKTWIHGGRPTRKLGEQYKKALLYDSAKVTAKMNSLINKTEWDSLRNTLKTLSPSLESFIIMRRNFITSYATICVAHWILGIGDRHLGNTLVIINSGRCLGIDFGLAFDAGVDLKIPELMPFRLTPQILGLLKPFTEYDLFGATMIHVLRALRNEQGPLLACMNVFIHEPLNWLQNPNNVLKDNENDMTGLYNFRGVTKDRLKYLHVLCFKELCEILNISNLLDVKWLPNMKINIVKKKLNGIKPSVITLKQLGAQHNEKYLFRYEAIISGTDDIERPRARASMKNDSLSCEDQVTCLLDQATDLNVLGRTYVGWRPWL